MNTINKFLSEILAMISHNIYTENCIGKRKYYPSYHSKTNVRVRWKVRVQIDHLAFYYT